MATQCWINHLNFWDSIFSSINHMCMCVGGGGGMNSDVQEKDGVEKSLKASNFCDSNESWTKTIAKVVDIKSYISFIAES